MKITSQQEMQYLKMVPLFQGLNFEELRIISLATRNFIYERGEVIVSEGDEGDEAYVIYSGEVEIYSVTGYVKVVSLNSLGSGEVFGELALF